MSAKLGPPPLVPVYFRRPGPEDWSPRIRKGLDAARRLAASLVSLTAVDAVAGWLLALEPEYHHYSMLVPYWQAHLILSAGLLFQDPKTGVIDYHTWILQDGTLDVRELGRHPDPAVRDAIMDWWVWEPGWAGVAWRRSE